MDKIYCETPEEMLQVWKHIEPETLVDLDRVKVIFRMGHYISHERNSVEVTNILTDKDISINAKSVVYTSQLRGKLTAISCDNEREAMRAIIMLVNSGFTGQILQGFGGPKNILEDYSYHIIVYDKWFTDIDSKPENVEFRMNFNFIKSTDLYADNK